MTNCKDGLPKTGELEDDVPHLHFFGSSCVFLLIGRTLAHLWRGLQVWLWRNYCWRSCLISQPAKAGNGGSTFGCFRYTFKDLQVIFSFKNVAAFPCPLEFLDILSRMFPRHSGAGEFPKICGFPSPLWNIYRSEIRCFLS